MGTFFAYTLYSGVFLLFLYLLYRMFLSGEKQIALNRTVLLVCYALAFAVWPLSHIEWHSSPSVEIPMGVQELDVSLLAVNPVAVAPNQPAMWPQVILLIYIVGASAVLLKTLFSTVRLLLYVRNGTSLREDGCKLIVMPGSDIAPFSFGHYIVMSEVDYSTERATVTAHELAHIRCSHYLDLLLAQTVCILLWYNPASWLMHDELKLIHEYQADAEVLDGGVDEKDYQMLLIRKTVGNRFHPLANNLNHSKLKKRIAMMQKDKSRGVRRLRLALRAIAPIAAIGIVNIPAVASGLSSLESTVLDVKNEKKGSNVEVSMKEAEFPGGYEKLMEFLAMNLRYPEIAQSNNLQGVSAVRFTVDADGSLSDVRMLESAGTDLDEEVIRVVRKMPKWTPAEADGQPVGSEFALPVRFVLKGMEESGFIRALAWENVTWLDLVEVVAYGVKTAAEPSKPAKGKSIPATSEETKTPSSAPVETNTTPSAPSETKIHKWYPTRMVSPGTSPKAPLFVNGVLTEKSRIAGFKPGVIESEDVYRPSAEYPDGRIDIKLKQPHTYIDISNSTGRLIVGPSGEKDCDNSAYEAVRVDGKILTESMAINIDDIESFDEIAPCDEYPKGLLDIRLKKK